MSLLSDILGGPNLREQRQEEQQASAYAIGGIVGEIVRTSASVQNTYRDGPGCSIWIRDIPVEKDLQEFTTQIKNPRNSSALLAMRAKTLKEYGEIYE